MVVEAAYPSTTGRAGPGDQNMVWPKTADGQKQFIADVIRTVKQAPEHRGIGVIYWIGGFFGGGTALFDQQGNPKPVLDVLAGQ
jgi:arabinogalactan endo-1,4-beta-galactosidase